MKEIELVLVKVNSIREAVLTMKDADRSKGASKSFIDDYNATLALAKKVASDIPPGVWPPHMETYTAAYCDIFSYATQLLKYLSSKV